ncbi:MAG: SCO family protein, partial [Bacteroidia bacterium]
TVDPETDTIVQLKLHADKYGVSGKTWYFLTGDKKALYQIAREGYLLDASEGDGGEEDFIHTQNFALLDKDSRIRGFYDGTDAVDVDRMITDIKVLIKQYEYESMAH